MADEGCPAVVLLEPQAGECLDSPGQLYDFVKKFGLGSLEDCVNFCNELDPLGQVGLTFFSTECYCYYNDGELPNFTGLGNSGRGGSGPIASGDGSDGVCYARKVRPSKKEIISQFLCSNNSLSFYTTTLHY